MRTSSRKKMKRSGSRIGSIIANPLTRTVAAAKWSKKQEAITGAMHRAQRAMRMTGQSQGPGTSASENLLVRTVTAAKRLRKTEEVTAALKKAH